LFDFILFSSVNYVIISHNNLIIISRNINFPNNLMQDF